jgi:hypothetical protein
VWTSYIQKHPGGAKFRKHGLEHYDELDELYRTATATGVHARKAASLVYSPTIKKADRTPSTSPGPSRRSSSPGPSRRSSSPTPKKTPIESEWSDSEPVCPATRRKRIQHETDSSSDGADTRKKKSRQEKADSSSDGAGTPKQKSRQENKVRTATQTSIKARVPTRKPSSTGIKTRVERSGKEKTAGKQLAGSIGEVAAVSWEVDFRLENAIELFSAEYQNRFSQPERFAASHILGDEKNARIFITLPADDRDYWIKKMIQAAMAKRSSPE